MASGENKDGNKELLLGNEGINGAKQTSHLGPPCHACIRDWTRLVSSDRDKTRVTTLGTLLGSPGARKVTLDKD